jgi:hypothetical protein
MNKCNVLVHTVVKKKNDMYPKYFRFIFILLALYIISCKKESTPIKTCPDYVKGDVIVGIKNTTSIQEVFTLFSKLNLPIDQMDGFFFTSPYPKDSLTSLITYLNTKPYIHTRDFSANAYVHYQTGIINVVTSFFNLNPVNQQDLVKTIEALKLVDTKGDTKDLFLKVPVGQETYWLKKLKENDMVTWTELNCIEQILPFMRQTSAE